MATAVLNIHSSEPGSPRLIPCRSQIGNEEQECDDGFTGDPIPANTLYRDTLAAANAAAAAELGCTEDVWSYISGSNALVQAVVIDASERVYIGGLFSQVDGLARSRIARLNGTTGLADSLDPSVSSNFSVDVLARQPDGKILVGGAFTTIWGATHNSIARLNADGSIDSAFVTSVLGGSVQAIALQPDGKIIIGGSFGTVNGVTKQCIARLNADGTLDTGFTTSAQSGGVATVYALAIQGDGSILIGGNFNSLNGFTRNNIGRVTSAGVIDSGFNPNASSTVFAIAITPSGQILVGGGFLTIAGASRSNIARLNSGGTIDASYNPGANNSVTGILAYGSTYIINGDFSIIASTSRASIARLNDDGSIVTEFNPGPTGFVYDVAITATGRIVVVGSFTAIAGSSRSNFARLESDGTLA